MQPVVSLNLKELRVVAVLASIFSLRMLGLCMLLPVFAREAVSYQYSTEQLIGLAIGIYGLAQAVLQIPFGILSDKYGRKPLIILGLCLLMAGSLIAAKATSIYGLIIGRSLQGCAAIGSVIIATLADHTREQVRTISMAILGISIGSSFVLAMVLGPWVNQVAGLEGIFGFTAILAVGGLFLLLITIPKTSALQLNPEVASFKHNLLALGRDAKLMTLNFGVFVLHASLAALFLVLPLLVEQAGFAKAKLWHLYFAVLIIALPLALILISKGERRQQIDRLQALAIAEGLLFTVRGRVGIVTSLIMFFTAFCILEASLPTLVSKYAPTKNRGAALGLYSSLQFLGIFFGGIMGGWLHGRVGYVAVLVFCLALATTWLGISLGINRRQGLNYG